MAYLNRRRVSGTYTLLFLGILGTFLIVPFLILFLQSLNKGMVSLPYPIKIIPRNPSFSNYKLLFEKYDVGKWTINSLIIAGGTSALQAITCSLAAFGFARTKFPMRDHIFWALMIMLVMPYQAQVLPLFLLMSKLKLVDTYFAWLPYTSSAFGIFLMRQYITSIPKELDEVAYIDGCSPFKVFFKIILPMIRPALVVLITFNFITQWNDFFYPLIVINSKEMYTLQLGLANIHSAGLRGEGGGMGVTMAGASISFIPMLIVFLILQKYIVEEISKFSGIKG